MLGRILVAAVAGMIAWKYRDSIREYARGNAEPAREKADQLLRTVQERSETLLDRAKEQIGRGVDSAREKLRGAPEREDMAGTSFRS